MTRTMYVIWSPTQGWLMRASHPCGTRDGYWRESLDDARLYRKRGAAQNVVKKLVRFGVVDAQVRKLEIRVVDDE